jgi:hypothetical protein
MPVANDLNHTWLPSGDDYRLDINAFLEAHDICPVTPMRYLHSPMTYSQPSSPIHTSCNFPAGTSIRAPTPNVSLVGFSS